MDARPAVDRMSSDNETTRCITISFGNLNTALFSVFSVTLRQAIVAAFVPLGSCRLFLIASNLCLLCGSDCEEHRSGLCVGKPTTLSLVGVRAP
jgi:hypothetical protein